MNSQTVRSNIMLLTTSCIWGLAFVAQRAGMEHIGPFAFNGIRFALGGASLLPLILYFNKRNGHGDSFKHILSGGILAGIVLFLGASFQQVGMVYTTASKAGFITGLYVVLVPILGLFLKQKSGLNTWIGALCAVAGMFLLGVKGDFSIEKGDLLVCISAIFWAAHVLIIGSLSKKIDPLKLSSVQFFTCSFISLITAFFTETTSYASVHGAMMPILYGGILSVGVAYTLQVIAQKHANAAHAAVIFSMESVFAALGGWLMLNETLSARGISGCAFIFAGMIVSQLTIKRGHIRAFVRKKILRTQ